MACRVETDGTTVQVIWSSSDGGPAFEKRFHFGPEASLRVDYTWDPAAFPAGGWFAPELSVATTREVICVPPAEVWRYDIATVAKSERGLEKTRQGTSLTPRWPVALGAASLSFGGH